MDTSAQASTVRHCPGCRGYTHGWGAECPGFAAGPRAEDDDFAMPDVVPPLRFLDRLRVLIGAPVLLGMGPAPLDEPVPPGGSLPEWPAFPGGPEIWKDAG